jgi:hypothetical protein
MIIFSMAYKESCHLLSKEVTMMDDCSEEASVDEGILVAPVRI